MPETVGAQLKRAREARKLSLEQVFQATRISVRYLQGLENDQPEALPSAVQGKGFLRLYAGFLNLPVAELLDQWEGKTPLEATIEVSVVEEPPAVEVLTAVEPPAPEPPAEEEKEVMIVSAVETPEEETPAAALVSQQIFSDIGRRLRERRLDLGLNIEEVERFTKLRRHYITALEEGRTGDLPSLVQGRGMLSNYARFLDLDVEDLLLRFADALQQRRAEMMPPPPPPGLLANRRAAQRAGRAVTGWRRLLTADVLIGGVIIFALVGFGFWGAAQVAALRSQALAAEATTMPIAEVLRPSDTPAVLQTPFTPPPTLAPNRELGNLPSDQQESSEVTPTGIPVLGDAPLQVYVVARKRAFLRVLVDGKEEFNGRVTPGNPYTFAGDEQVEVITGDASALQVFFNQADLGSLGDNAEVRTLIFTSEGIITPTPAFTITPTPTRAPTITATPTPTQPSPTVTPFIP